MLNLPPLVRQKILLHNAKDVFNRVPILRFAPTAARLTLSSSITPLTMFPGDTVFDIGTTADSIYFIYNGEIEIFLPADAIGHDGKKRRRMAAANQTTQAQHEVICADIGNGCYFGDCGVVLDHCAKRSASARVGKTVAHCDLYVLTKKALREFAQDYALLWSHLQLVAARRLARVRHRQGLLEKLPPLFSVDMEDLKTQQAHKEDLRVEAQGRKMYMARAIDADHDDDQQADEKRQGGSGEESKVGHGAASKSATR